VEYLYIVLIAILIFPILFWLIKRGKLKWMTFILVLMGMNIAIIGVFIQNYIPIYGSIFTMLLLVYFISILVEKRKVKEEDRGQMNREQ